MSLDWIGDTLLPRLLAAGLQSLLVVAAVGLLCRYLRLSAALRCWLWWCAALQLLLGVLWPTPLSLPLLPASWDQVASVAPSAPQLSAAAQLPFFVTRGDLATAAPSIASALPAATPSMDTPWWSWTLAFAALWLSGLLLMALASARGYTAARRRVAESLPCDQSQVLATYRALGDSLGMRRLPPLRLSAQIDSPQLIGPWPQAVLLPRERLAHFSGDELAMALHHELVHVRRRDLWWGWVPALVQHLFFFHPLAHVIAREYSLAREAACDAAVLESRRYAARDYGRLLLHLGVAPRPAAGVASASPTYTVLKRRLTMLHNTKASSHLGGLLLTAAVVLISLVPYRVTAAAGESYERPHAQPHPQPMAQSQASVQAQPEPRVQAQPRPTPQPQPQARPQPQAQSHSRTVSSNAPNQRNGETRITQLHNGGAPQVWAVRGDQYYEVGDDGSYRPVRDPAVRADLQRRMRDSEQAAIEAEQAGREAQRAGQEAERAGREAQRHAQRASLDAQRAGRDAAREASEAAREAGQAAAEAAREGWRTQEQGRLATAQALRDAEQARRDAAQHQRDAQQAARDHEQAMRDADRARLEAAQRAREAVQAGRDAEQRARDAAQAGRDAEQRARDAERAQRDAHKRARDAARNQISIEIGTQGTTRLTRSASSRPTVADKDEIRLTMRKDGAKPVVFAVKDDRVYRVREDGGYEVASAVELATHGFQ